MSVQHQSEEVSSLRSSGDGAAVRRSREDDGTNSTSNNNESIGAIVNKPTNTNDIISSIKPQNVTVIDSEEKLTSLLETLENTNANSSKNTNHQQQDWIAFIVHAPWSWPNFHPRRGFVNTILDSKEINQEGSSNNNNNNTPLPPLECWQWIVEHSKVPICTIDINQVHNVNVIFKGMTLSSVPMICLYNARSKNFIQKQCKTYVDIASQTLLTPITNKKELEEKILEQQEQNENKKHLTVAYIGAAFCAPCTRVMPAIPDFAREFKNANFLKIDFDAGHELVEALSIEKIPTFCAFDHRKADGSNKDKLEFSANGTQLPFGSLQHSDATKVAEAIRQWCDLAETKQSKNLTEEMFTCDDF